MSSEGKSTDGSAHSDSRLLKILVYSSFIVPAIISILSILSWAFDNISIISVSPDYVPIVPSTSISIALLSFGLFACTKVDVHKAVRGVATASIISAFALNIWILLPVQPDPEEMIDPLGTVVGGYFIERASPITLLATISCSIATMVLFFRLHERSRLLRRTLTALSLLLLSIGIFTCTGYLYGNPLLYGAPIKPVALLAAVSFLFLGMGLLLVEGPKSWPLRLFMGKTVRARLLRIFLPISIIVVLMEGLVLIILMPESANPGHAVVTSTIAFITAILMGAFISRISQQLGTDIDRTNELLIKTRDELAQANERLKVLDSITRHDSINQLTMLMGRLGMLKETINDKALKQQIDDPLKAAQSIEQILMFARDYQAIGNEAPTWSDVGQTFKNAMRVVRLPDSIAVKIEVDGLQILADKMFEKVFLNLLDNSMRYGEHVKNIRLSYHKQWDGILRLRYEDDGVGISDEDKKRLFQRGFGKHTGLGLFLSKEILSYSGLSITEKGEFGKGAEFEIRVPEGKYRL